MLLHQDAIWYTFRKKKIISNNLMLAYFLCCSGIKKLHIDECHQIMTSLTLLWNSSHIALFICFWIILYKNTCNLPASFWQDFCICWSMIFISQSIMHKCYQLNWAKRCLIQIALQKRNFNVSNSVHLN